jgi:hypothetical protein
MVVLEPHANLQKPHATRARASARAPRHTSWEAKAITGGKRTVHQSSPSAAHTHTHTALGYRGACLRGRSRRRGSRAIGPSTEHRHGHRHRHRRGSRHGGKTRTGSESTRDRGLRGEKPRNKDSCPPPPAPYPLRPPPTKVNATLTPLQPDCSPSSDGRAMPVSGSHDTHTKCHAPSATSPTPLARAVPFTSTTRYEPKLQRAGGGGGSKCTTGKRDHQRP